MIGRNNAANDMSQIVRSLESQMNINRQEQRIVFPGNIIITPATKRSEFERNYSQYIFDKSNPGIAYYDYWIRQPDLGFAMIVYFYDEWITNISFGVLSANILASTPKEAEIKKKEVHNLLLQNLLNDPDSESIYSKIYELGWVKIYNIQDDPYGNGPSIKFQFRRIEDLSPREANIAKNNGKIPDRYNSILKQMARWEIEHDNQVLSVVYENGTIGIRMENPLKDDEAIRQILNKHDGHDIVPYTPDQPRIGSGYICKTTGDFIEYVEKP
ncbi:MAG: hypothetical protein EYC62_09035 [Alphaproteobacteria bacterium]|nr:MAG: hypothetical protein EYC62_09035 [Alphaproteobacteria bacterium]